MQKWVQHSKGTIEKLRLEEIELPELENGFIRIETKSIGLNFADIFALYGLYSATPKGAFTPGLEYAGIVTEVNAQTSFRIGDRVIGISRFNGYSSHIDIEPVYCIPLPEEWSFSQGAAYMVQTLTAWYALKHLGNIQPKQNIVVNSAAGGVGLQAMKLINAYGAHPIGTVRSQTKKDFLTERGFSDVIVRAENFSEQLKTHLNERPLHMILDAIGGSVQKALYKQLAPMGRLVVFGSADFTPKHKRINVFKALVKYLKRPTYDPLQMIENNHSVLGFNLIWLWEQKELLKQLLDEINEYMIDPPHVGHEYPFEQAIEAVHALKSGETIGKVVLVRT